MNGVAGNNYSDLSEMNRSVIVKILQKREICTRAEIARLTGLTQASITKIIATLIEMGIVSEIGSVGGCGNRRAIGLKLNADKYQVVGIKLGRNMFATGSFDISGKLYTQKNTNFSSKDDRNAVLKMIKEQVQFEIDNNPHVVAVGLALPGPYLRDEGYVAVISQMNEWKHINFNEEFCNAFSVPVFIEHDANAGALASWWFEDREKPVHTLAYLLVGDGVGCGIIEDGRLLLGSQGAACEIGHTSIDLNGERCECGNYGCLELFCSATAMINRIKKEIPYLVEVEKCEKSECCDKLFDLARAGDKAAISIVDDFAKYLAYACVNLINLYNPTLITIGDILSKGGDLLLPKIKEVVEDRVVPSLYKNTSIEVTKLSIDPTLYGAAASAAEQVLCSPTNFLSKKDFKNNGKQFKNGGQA